MIFPDATRFPRAPPTPARSPGPPRTVPSRPLVATETEKFPAIRRRPLTL